MGMVLTSFSIPGVHGSLIACHNQFTSGEFAELLQIPKEKLELRRVLSNEFNLLLSCGTERGNWVVINYSYFISTGIV